MIFFEFYQFIVPKVILINKYPGGLIFFKADLPNTTYTEDTDIVCVRFLTFEQMNEFVNEVARKGLHFHKEDFYSDDFMVFTTLGPWWNCKWLHFNIHMCSFNNKP